MVDTIGWTISQWKDYTSSTDPAQVLDTLTALVSSFSKDDPAWISTASPDQIKEQFAALKEQKSVSTAVSPFNSPSNTLPAAVICRPHRRQR